MRFMKPYRGLAVSYTHLNDKGHFTDCSELVNTVCEVVELPWIAGKSLHDSFSGATVYEAVAA